MNLTFDERAALANNFKNSFNDSYRHAGYIKKYEFLYEQRLSKIVPIPGSSKDVRNQNTDTLGRYFDIALFYEGTDMFAWFKLRRSKRRFKTVKAIYHRYKKEIETLREFKVLRGVSLYLAVLTGEAGSEIWMLYRISKEHPQIFLDLLQDFKMIFPMEEI